MNVIQPHEVQIFYRTRMFDGHMNLVYLCIRLGHYGALDLTLNENGRPYHDLVHNCNWPHGNHNGHFRFEHSYNMCEEVGSLHQ